MKKHLQKAFWITSFLSASMAANAQKIVKDITVGSTGTEISSLTKVQNMVYFIVNGSSNPQLWKTDGTEEGTALVKDINPTGSDAVANLINYKDTLYFTANDGTAGIELWKTDGSEAGTKMVKDIRTVMLQGDLSSTPTSLVVMNGYLYFSAHEGAFKQSLWKSDGSEAGTVALKYFSGASGKGPNSLTVVKNTLYFNADDGSTGRELWKSNGTAEGTVLVKDIFSGSSSNSSDPTMLTAVGDTLFFKAFGQSLHANQIWMSDGTDAGTVLVKDIQVSSTSYLTSFFNFKGSLLFKYNADLWKSNGTDAGTMAVSTFSKLSMPTVVDGKLYFFGDEKPSVFTYLWKMDDLASKPVKVSNYFTIVPNNGIVAIDGNLYFTADDNKMVGPDYIPAGMELWKSNGTIAGTVLVKDIFPGGVQYQSGNHSSPSNYFNLNGILLFTANDGIHGQELMTYTPSVSGIVDLFGSSNLNVYPNPNTGKFSVGNFDNEKVEISVYNVLGEKVLNSENAKEINLGDAPAGIYFIKVVNGTKNFTSKIIKE